MSGLAELTLQLCRISSVTGSEHEIAQYIERRCAAMAHVVVLRVGNAVVARGPALADRPTVALFGHSDTVRPAAAQETLIRDGRVFGCGASDMKGGLAVMLTLLEEAGRLDGANLLCVFYDREEGPALESGILPLLDEGEGVLSGVDLALCLEPTDNRVHAGCVGGIHALLTFSGRRAHSARPWQGENAIYAALPFLNRVQGFARRPVDIEGLRFYEVMSATQASTDNSRNVIPDRFVVNVNFRFAPGKPAAAAVGELMALVGDEARVEVVDVAPSGSVCLDQPLLRSWIARRGLQIEAKQAWTDVARLTERGVPAVNFGPGETALAHQADESVSIEALEQHLLSLRDLLGAR